jgi:DNA-binding response OmpR family regulator
MRLQVTNQNIIPLLSSLIQSFESLARSKEIELIFNKPDTAVEIYIDQEIVEKIMINLLTNACKFTPQGGRIETNLIIHDESLPVEKQPLSEKSDGQCAPCNAAPNEGGYVEISITNSGSYLTPQQTDHIFDRFYQADTDHSNGQPGTGIGLALCKEMVKLHKGTIHATSSVKGDTAFTVRLPVDLKNFSADEVSAKSEKTRGLKARRSSAGEKVDKERAEAGSVTLPLSSCSEGETPLLLIVEDNKDVRNYIKGILDEEYETREAGDGESGYRIALKQMPDLIISDVMMPGMDGYEMTSRLKNDDRTSHIPIILLTAKAAPSDKINGYKQGADDYIMKPFEAQELTVRIKNLIEQRRKLRRLFIKESIFSLENKVITPLDKKFLEKAVQIIKKHLADTSFNVDAFARELSIGRTTLFKKIMALVGEPPSELIKRVRLTHAAYMLKKNAGNVSEIALDVGFSNPAYFSKCFRKQFGVNPSQYIHTFTFQS